MPKGHSKMRRGADLETKDVFPPLSTSLENFVDGQSDRALRELVNSLRSLSAVMVRNREYFAAYVGVTSAQYTIMSFVADDPDTTVGQLAEHMSVSSPFITVEVAKLIGKNIVEKSPNRADGRSMLLNLTAKGQTLLRESNLLRRRANDLTFRSLTPDRAKALQETLGMLIAGARSALHELEAPDRRGMRAPSAESNAADRAAAADHKERSSARSKRSARRMPNRTEKGL
jgi:MarR family transcriptional regulator, organic hydroperoxide resistance regulator